MPTYRPGQMSAIMVDKMDASTYLNTSDWSSKLGTAEVSHYGSTGKEFIPGLMDASLSYGGMYDGTLLANYPSLDQLEDSFASLATNYPVTMLFDGGVAVGRRCAIAAGIQTSYAISTPVANAASVKVNVAVNGRPGDGYCLTDGVAIATATTVNYTSQDAGAGGGTTTGGIGAIHVVANTRTGTTTVKIQHSTDNSVWVDLVSQTVAIGTAIAYLNTVSGTVNRYLRAQVTTAAGTGSIRVIAAFART